MNGDKQMIQKAAVFAAKAHEGMMRKGSRIPYIYHPMEVALIVAQMTDDPEVIAAAYLHDVLEDTSVTPEELERRSASDIRDYRYPLVLMYLVDAVAADGQPRTQEVSPWAYRRLERRAKQGACQNTI